MTKTAVQRREKVVVIEDEADILEVVRYNLSREGFRVLTCRDGEDARPTPPPAPRRARLAATSETLLGEQSPKPTVEARRMLGDVERPERGSELCVAWVRCRVHRVGSPFGPSSSLSRSAARARLSRDATVPSGTPRIAPAAR